MRSSGVLFYSTNLNGPSHLWMRRMLEMFGPQETAVWVADRDPGVDLSARYHVSVLRPAPWEKAAARLTHSRLTFTNHRLDTRLLGLVRQRAVSGCLVHYVTNAVKHAYVWRQTDKPVFAHCHGWDVTWDMRQIDDPHTPSHAPDYVQQVLALPHNVRFIANSQETKRRLLTIGIDETRIHVKYLGVEVPDRPIVRNRTADEIRILYLGRLVDCKGPDLTIMAFERAVAQGMNARLTIAGDGHLRIACELLRARSSARDRIHLIGAVDGGQGAALRRESDIFTAHNCLGPISRQEESFGVSIAEAMADCLPVTTGRSGSVPELIEDGREGILFEPGDVAAHADALARLARCADERVRLGVNAWQKAGSMFTLADEKRRLRQLFGFA